MNFICSKIAFFISNLFNYMKKMERKGAVNDAS